MREYNCWKCGGENMPFLDEDEWENISPHLEGAIVAIKDYREKHQCDLTTAKLNYTSEATRLFELITGMPDINFETIYHHRLKDWGPECKNCAQLLRTPRASYCANCGTERS